MIHPLQPHIRVFYFFFLGKNTVNDTPCNESWSLVQHIELKDYGNILETSLV